MNNNLIIEKLSSSHELDKFDCEQKALNGYLSKYALINQKMRISVTYLALKGPDIVGFYSLASGSVRHEDAPKKAKRGLPQYDIPILLLARLAVDKKEKGKGIGSGLLKDSMLRALNASKEFGVRALLVHAKDNNAVEFYKRFDFDPSPINPKHLFLTIKDIEKNLSP